MVNIELDKVEPPTSLRTVSFNGEVVDLSERQGRIVAALVRAGRPLDRMTLYRAAWPGDARPYNPNRLDGVLMAIRKKMPGLIENEWGAGWRLARGARVLNP